MRQVIRLLRIRAGSRPEPALVAALDDSEKNDGLTGYILEPRSTAAPPDRLRAWGYMVVVTGTLGKPEAGTATPMRPPLEATRHQRLPLRPVGRLVPVVAPQRGAASQSEPEAPEAPTAARTLRPVRSGRSYRITSRPERGLVRPELAEALEAVFERFANERSFSPEALLEIRLSRGFKAGSHGHGEGRAADIVAVGGKRLLAWKQEWDQALASAEKLSDPQERAEAIAVEKKRNLGYGLYKALQAHGGWRVNQVGWRPYRGVAQLFGPWTATEGPWKQMQFENPNPYQQERLADQRWVFQAHQDHIHLAR